MAAGLIATVAPELKGESDRPRRLVNRGDSP
jgi:hypothetical protein